jgi:mannosyltransferase OCH1-like enzyme
METTLTQFHIFQTHKSAEYINSKPILVNAIQSWKYLKDFKHFLYSNKDCDDFIKNHFERKVYEAYSRLPMGVMKADLWRYCIIYKYGGIYADVDTFCINNPKLFINDSLLTVAPENNVHLCNWAFSAPKQSPILKSVIDLSVERILTIPEIRGEHVIHYLTGPGVFTEGIELYLKNNNLNLTS